MYTCKEVEWTTNKKEKTVAELEGMMIRDNGKDLIIRGNPTSRRLQLGGQALWSSVSSLS